MVNNKAVAVYSKERICHGGGGDNKAESTYISSSTKNLGKALHTDPNILLNHHQPSSLLVQASLDYMSFK